MTESRKIKRLARERQAATGEKYTEALRTIQASPPASVVAAGAATAQPRGMCWYCEGEGLTKEHIFAQSLIDLFRGHGMVRHAYEHPELGVKPRIKRAKTFAYISRKFCRQCNGGWMREMDEAVRPLLGAFATEVSVVLGAEEQELLAAWATKTTLGLLSIEPEEYRFASRQQYRDFYEAREPWTGTQVWLGANVHGDLGWGRAHSLMFRDLPDQTSGFGASLSFGYAVFHLIHHGSEDHSLRLRHEPHRALKQIWPTQPNLTWPNRFRVREADMTPLANLIGANSDFVQLSPTR